ncbi:hypothetical protein L1987_35791 [Smallanthus sonchifolius]|uniref:Uncharacterized protein n=1 Tax=Smallanthus sonchifolius TaxID=185202 RepID=A0ACB9HCE2_9ASTR|nr:hypothetical protein L1987_35791 [Smallanthus sonchifolius]
MHPTHTSNTYILLFCLFTSLFSVIRATFNLTLPHQHPNPEAVVQEVQSYKTIDGRGANVAFTGGGCITLHEELLVQHAGVKEEFENEIKLISNIHHRNLLRLLGWSIEGSYLLLVLEYMPNGSLDRFLWGIGDKSTYKRDVGGEEEDGFAYAAVIDDGGLDARSVSGGDRRLRAGCCGDRRWRAGFAYAQGVERLRGK